MKKSVLSIVLIITMVLGFVPNTMAADVIYSEAATMVDGSLGLTFEQYSDLLASNNVDYRGIQDEGYMVRQRASFGWDKYNLFLKKHAILKPKVYVSIYATKNRIGYVT